ncbi:cation-transporting P-type ATPase [Methanococcus maripaludis]|uniref:cation-translocating P-type ATPase n=1 Tax=Methanococcus maripaludis TaxID=39152 RepID=UPI0031435E85
MPDTDYYLMPISDVFKKLDTEKSGLSNVEAENRLNTFGKNELNAEIRLPKWLKFLFQFKDVFAAVLIFASAVSFLIGNYRDGTIMALIVIINAVIGYYQENKAENIMDSLKKLIQSPSKVYRDGELKEISQELLVVGDIVHLDEGDKVPADIRLIESYNLSTNDFSLTGESMPQEKDTEALDSEVGVADRTNMVYLGTNIATGNSKGVVVATGMATELGRIANLTREEKLAKSPLQVELSNIANKITIFAVVIASILFLISLNQGLGLKFGLIYGLGIAVAIVPQALPMQITVALANGVSKLAKKNAVIKKLSAVETLGSTNVITTDKTGTLTKNEITVRSIWFDGKEYEITGVGYEPKGTILDVSKNELDESGISNIELIFNTATMASTAKIHEPDENHYGWYPIGDPTEAALITAARKLDIMSLNEDEKYPKIQEFSFDSVRKRMSSIRLFNDKKMLMMKGALDSVISVSKYIYKDGKLVDLKKEDIEMVNELNIQYSKKAMRVLAFAYRELGNNEGEYSIENTEKDMVFLGLMAMSDPPKEGVKDAIKKAHEAHIKTYIMTGDHAITAQAVGKQIFLADGGREVKVITGKELDSMPDDELKQNMAENDALIFSRTSPENKLRIVKTLKEQGQIVAVTGDGVNDAPALKSSHIGVAMGKIGTDVSKEASELILLDDSFTTLVYAIREGRTIYNNLTKTIIASLTSNGGELTIVLIGLLAVAYVGWPMPILTIQILAIDLLAEILPLTALTFDPASRDIMNAPPRRKEEHVLNKYAISEILFFGFLMGFLAFLNFGLFIFRNDLELTQIAGVYPLATTISYSTIAFCQFMNILSRRYSYETLFSRTLFTNMNMIYSILISIAFTLTAIYVSPINKMIGFAPMGLVDWAYVLLASFVFLGAHELLKVYKRHKKSGKHATVLTEISA